MNNKAEYKELFNAGGCLSQLAIERYIDGLLDETSKEIIMKHAQDCPLCADALEGVSHFTSASQFSKSVTKMQNSGWRKSLEDKHTIQKRLYILTSAAASFILLVGLFYLVWSKSESGLNKLNREQQEIAFAQPSKTATGINDTLLMEPQIERIAEQKPEIKPKPEARVRLDKVNEEPIVEAAEERIGEADMESVMEDEAMPNSPVIQEEAKSKEVTKAEAAPAAVYKKEVKELKYNADKNTEDYYSGAAASEVQTNDKGMSRSKKDFKSGEAGKLSEVKEDAQFQGGGTDSFKKYLVNGLKDMIPDSLKVNKLRIGYTINTAGKLEKIKLINGTGSESLDNRIIEYIRNSPAWIPQKVNGISVETDQLVEISIK